MLTFSQHLTEGREAPLYHGTGGYDLIKIADTGTLIPFTVHLPHKLLKDPSQTTVHQTLFGISPFQLGYTGVSFTRSIKYANRMGPVVFVVNQRQLAHTYEIKPIQYFSDGTRRQYSNAISRADFEEYEEFVLTKKPIPILKYLIEVKIEREVHNYMLGLDVEKWQKVQECFGDKLVIHDKF